MRKITRRLLSFVFALLTVISISSCGAIEVVSYEMHTELQKSYLEGEYDHIMLYAQGIEELSKPNPIVISWDATKDVKDYDFFELLVKKAFQFKRKTIKKR